MIQKQLVNTEHIVSINTIFDKQCHDFEYRKGINILGCQYRKEGFYYRGYFDFHFVTEYQIKEMGLFIIDGLQIFYKPHLKLNMTDHSTHTKYFESKEDMSQFIDQYDLIGNKKWIPNFSEK